MTDEIKKENEELLDLFSHPGWKHLNERMDEIISALEDVRSVQSEKELFIRQGELKNMDWLKNFPELVRMALDANL